jgi:hypothetical protein
MKHVLVVGLVASVLAGCSQIPPQAMFNRGSPESLMDVSSEVVSVKLNSVNAVDQMVEWIDKDEPTRAELHCSVAEDPVCKAAAEVFKLYGIDTQQTGSGERSVDLVYERVMARECDNRFMDNHINPYHMNHPTFGCSIASNMVQSVSNKQQFVHPPLLGFRDGRKAIQDVREYRKPPSNEDASGGRFQVDQLNTN